MPSISSEEELAPWTFPLLCPGLAPDNEGAFALQQQQHGPTRSIVIVTGQRLGSVSREAEGKKAVWQESTFERNKRSLRLEWRVMAHPWILITRRDERLIRE
jgi:hypothetical protein